MTERPRRRRISRAETSLRVGPRQRDGPVEFDGFERARAAGVLAARRADEWLPAVTAAEVREVDVEIHEPDDGLDVVVTVVAYAREPVDGRALLAAQVCATNLADRASNGAGSITVEQTTITERRGGEEGLGYDFAPPVTVQVATVSDAVVDGHKEDRAGDTVAEAVEDLADYGVELAEHRVVPDDRDTIEEVVDDAVGEVDLLLTVGGTGLTHTDTTVEVVEPKFDRPVPGLMEQAREHGRSQTPLAFVSRGVAGLVDETLVVTLPGSSSGAAESVDALFPAILHTFKVRRRSRRELTDGT